MPRMRPNPSASAPHCASRERARAKFSPMDLLELLPSTWQPLLGVEGESALAQVGKFLDAEEQAERSFQPQAERLFRALTLTPPLAVRCVLTGQDPYPTPNVPTGLSFDVGPTAPLSGSLRNIFREFVEDTLLPRPSSGDLTPWTEHCLLLNAALSCQPGVAGSHDKCGWHGVTQALLTGLTAINPDIVFLCWGARALSMVKTATGRTSHCLSPPVTTIRSSRLLWLTPFHAHQQNADRVRARTHQLAATLGDALSLIRSVPAQALSCMRGTRS
jgi:uracil-DNA glycosylase